MEWIAAAIVFCFLMWRWPRKTLLSAAVVGVVSVLGGLGTAGYYFAKDKADDRRRGKLLAEVVVDAHKCGPETPILVQFSNETGGIVSSFFFDFHIYERGKSTDLTGSQGAQTVDYVLKEGGSLALCFACPPLRGVWIGDPKTTKLPPHIALDPTAQHVRVLPLNDLDIRAKITRVNFGDTR